MTIRAQTGPGAPARDIEPHRLAVLAAALLMIDDARLYGLIDGDPGIDRSRCTQIVERCRAQGVVPELDEVSAAAIELMAALGAVRP